MTCHGACVKCGCASAECECLARDLAGFDGLPPTEKSVARLWVLVGHLGEKVQATITAADDEIQALRGRVESLEGVASDLRRELESVREQVSETEDRLADSIELFEVAAAARAYEGTK